VNLSLAGVADDQRRASISLAKDVNLEFGDLYKAMLALWSAVSGGNDWMMYGSLL
ncbi:unnamed protein product, partial [Symbiodinium pilosum]